MMEGKIVGFTRKVTGKLEVRAIAARQGTMHLANYLWSFVPYVYVVQIPVQPEGCSSTLDSDSPLRSPVG